MEFHYLFRCLDVQKGYNVRIFITGATGFVGLHVIQKCLNENHEMTALVRSAEKADQITSLGAAPVYGDIMDPASFISVLEGCDAIIHLVAIIEENPKKNITFENINFKATKELVRAAEARGIDRFIYMSALNADPDDPAPYFASKGKAEKFVQNSRLNYTILRPSFIVGPGMPVYSMLARMIKKTPLHIFPVFGSGQYKHQPIAVDDVVKSLTRAVSDNKNCSGTFDIGGPEPLSYNEQLRQIAEVTGKRVRLWHHPLWLSRIGVGLLSLFPRSPIDQDRLSMLIRDNICDISEFKRVFKIQPMPFKNAIQYLAE